VTDVPEWANGPPTSIAPAPATDPAALARALVDRARMAPIAPPPALGPGRIVPASIVPAPARIDRNDQVPIVLAPARAPIVHDLATVHGRGRIDPAATDPPGV
jgi:hypothetical protein